MSQGNVEIVRRMLEAWGAGDAEESLSHYDPEVVWDNRIRPEATITHGIDEMLAALRTWVGTFSSYSLSYEELIDAGDDVVAVAVQRGTGKASGVEVEETFAMVYTLRSGKIVLQTSYKTRQEALRAVSLSE
jgi:ketosteroid isomerase-like protein